MTFKDVIFDEIVYKCGCNTPKPKPRTRPRVR